MRRRHTISLGNPPPHVGDYSSTQHAETSDVVPLTDWACVAEPKFFHTQRSEPRPSAGRDGALRRPHAQRARNKGCTQPRRQPADRVFLSARSNAGGDAAARRPYL